MNWANALAALFLTGGGRKYPSRTGVENLIKKYPEDT